MGNYKNGIEKFRPTYFESNRLLTIRPTFNQARISAVSKPTAVFLGAFQGYSMPIWNETTNAEEELFYRFKIPERWDGKTDPVLHFYTYLSVTEDVGDNFKFEFGYNCVDCDDGALTDTVHLVYDDATITTGHSAQYTPYCLTSAVSTSNLFGEGLFAGRIRRVASDGIEVSGEIVAMYLTMEFPVDKIYATWDL